MTSPANSNGFAKSLFENNLPVMLIIRPEDGNIVDANIAACKYYGYCKSDMTSMTIMDINIPTNELVYEEMHTAKLEKCNRFNFRHRLANGEVKDVEVFSGPIIYKGEKLLYSIIHDISEQKFAEEQVKKEKSFSESLILSLPGIMYLFDEYGRLQRWNKNLEEVTGFSPEEIKNMTPLDFIAPEDERVVQKAIEKVFNRGSADIEAGLLTKDGQIIPYFFTGVRLINHNLKYLVGVGLDVSEKKRKKRERKSDKKISRDNVPGKPVNRFTSDLDFL